MATPPTPVLDFSRVQTAAEPPAPTDCQYCGRGLNGEYFRVQGAMTCGVCATNVRGLLPTDSPRAFVRALLWGIPAALVGMAAYAVFAIATGIEIGWIAIGVGWLVGKAMLRGSGGVRGRRYQWTAMLLTYAAVAMAFIPIQITLASREERAKAPAVASQPAQQQGSPASGAAAAKGSEPSGHGFLYAIGMLVGIGLISPFYVLFQSVGSGLLGLLILFWGMQMAWKMMAAPRIAVDGPFPLAAAR